MMALEERFWAKVDKSGECWTWTACKLPKGYGRFGINGAVILAHRMAYTLAYGQIAEGAHIDHTCYNPSCVRPSHLRAVSPKQNIENRGGVSRNNTTGARGVSRTPQGRFRASVKHCGKDHWVGVFDTVDEAAEAARLKRLELFTHSDADRHARAAVTRGAR